MVRDDHLGDARAFLRGIRGDEAVHLPVQVNVVQQPGAIGLQHAAIVVQMHAGDQGDELVGDPGREAAREPRVSTRPPPAADDVVPFGEFGQEPRDIARVVLEVGVHRAQHRAPRAGDAGSDGRRLAVVAAELDDPDVGVPGRQVTELREAGVDAAVVDIDHLVRLAQFVQHARQRLVQRRQVVLFVEHRDHDGQVHRGRERTMVTTRVRVHRALLQGRPRVGIVRHIGHLASRLASALAGVKRVVWRACRPGGAATRPARGDTEAAADAPPPCSSRCGGGLGRGRGSARTA